MGWPHSKFQNLDSPLLLATFQIDGRQELGAEIQAEPQRASERTSSWNVCV